MFETFVIAIIFLFLNLIFIFRPTPIVAIPIALFIFYVSTIVFLKDSTMPLHPYFTVFLLMTSGINILINGLSTMEKK